MTAKEVLDTAKSALALAQGAFIALLVIAIFTWPALINRAISGLGIEEFDLWGLKVQTSLSRVSSELASQMQINEALMDALKKLNASEAVVSAAKAAVDNTEGVLAANARQIAAAQKAVAVPGSWVVVFGADATEEAARPEIDRAKNAQFSNARIYLRESWYRSGVEFPTRESAAGALGKIKQLSGYSGGAYIVSLANWCPNPTERSDGVTECH